jgi:hypothetical protein
MLVLIPFRSSAFVARLVSFCRDDPRYNDYALIKKRRVPAMAPASRAACIGC